MQLRHVRRGLTSAACIAFPIIDGCIPSLSAKTDFFFR